ARQAALDERGVDLGLQALEPERHLELAEPNLHRVAVVDVGPGLLDDEPAAGEVGEQPKVIVLPQRALDVRADAAKRELIDVRIARVAGEEPAIELDDAADPEPVSAILG